MNWQQLLAIAQMLAAPPPVGETRGRPHQMNLRKANSFAYYATFYALANSNADTLIGSAPNVRSSDEWTRIHRALNHGIAKNQMLNQTQMSSFHSDIQDFAETFTVLQTHRHQVDYNPNLDEPLTRAQTLLNIHRAQSAIEAFLHVPAQERRRFATHVLFVQRNQS